MDRDTQRAALEGLLSVRDIAQRLGLSRQRVDQLTRRDDFPASIITLSGTRYWAEADIEEFMKVWDRTPGRRRVRREHGAAHPPSVDRARAPHRTDPADDNGAAAPAG